MKTRILSIILVLLMCLTAGCGKVSQSSEKPDGISSSESKTEQSPITKSSQVEEQISPQTIEQQGTTEVDGTMTEETESDTKPKTVSEVPKSSTSRSQVSEPQQKKDESVSRSETPSTPVTHQSEEKTPEQTEAPPKQAETTAQQTESTPQTTEQPQTEPAEPAFDIGYWISFAKNYALSVGLNLDSGAVYCWDNPIAAGPKCSCTERDIKGYLNRYANDGDITDVWIWYEQVSDSYFEVYIGYA